MKPIAAFLLLGLSTITAGCQSGARAEAPAVARRHTCPMHPGYVSDQPGDCPICGMKLVPVDAQPAPAATSREPPGSATVRIDPERRRLIGLRTAPAQRVELARAIRTSGRVTVDETRLAKVQPRFEGFIETLDADFTGKQVRKGQRLASIHSPELLAVQQELLLAARGRTALAGAGLPDAEEAPRARLRLLGVSDARIAEVIRTGKPRRTFDVVSPISGVITTKNAVAGARVTLDQPLFEIVDLSSVWVMADAYEADLPGLKLGQTATITLAYWPGRSWSGRVSYILPVVDEKTRTIKVRIAVPNPSGELRPEMFADVVLRGTPRTVVAIPEDAVLDTGSRHLVFVDAGEGRLEPRAVQVGERSDGLVEVRGGVAEGEAVALGASFLLDSESRLKAAIQTMAPPAPAAPADHTGHSGHGGAP